MTNITSKTEARRSCTLLDLGSDIWLHILPLLSLKDVEALSLTCRSLHEILLAGSVWHIMYQGAFNDPNSSALKEKVGEWKELMQLRMKTSVFVWGCISEGRLGIPLDTVPHNLFRRPDAIYSPVKATGFQGPIVEMAMGGVYTAALNLAGQVIMVGDFNGARTAGSLVGMQAQRQLCLEHRVLTESNGFKFKYLSAGRTHLLAVTAEGEICVWQATKRSAGHRLAFPFQLPIVKVVAGWSADAAIVPGMGIVIFWAELPAERLRAEAVAPMVTVDITVVPHTAGQGEWSVADLGVGAGFIMFVANGRLFTTSIPGSSSEPVEVPEYLEAAQTLLPKEDLFVKVYANCYHWAAISAKGVVVEGDSWDKPSDQRKIRLVSGLEDIVEVALGDYHTLALTNSGGIYSWGLEPSSTGALGLGSAETLEGLGANIRGARWRRPDATLDSPHKVDLGWAVKISAGGWQSAALVVDLADSSQ